MAQERTIAMNKSADPGTQQSAPLSYVGEPLDGRHYIDVIEEQLYAEQRPSHEEQRPHRALETERK